MPYQYDPELAVVLPPELPRVAVHDIATRRRNATGLVDLFAAIPIASGIRRTVFHTRTGDGHVLDLVWYCAEASQDADPPGPALLQVHGGGFISFSVHDFHHALSNLVAESGVPMLCVDYRLAPEHPFPTPLDDCYTALIWLHEHARELNVDATRIGLYGDSAGGGLAAGVALLARDRGLSPPLAKQVLVAPMLDDRIATHDAELAPFLVFSYDDKITSWAAYLGPSTRTGTHDSLSSSRPITNTSSSNNAVPAPRCKYAAPARETDLVGLPATYLEVGELDCFRDEVLDYTRRLVSARVGVEFHLYPGCFHAFDVFAPNAGVSQRAKTNLIRALRSF